VSLGGDQESHFCSNRYVLLPNISFHSVTFSSSRQGTSTRPPDVRRWTSGGCAGSLAGCGKDDGMEGSIGEEDVSVPTKIGFSVPPHFYLTVLPIFNADYRHDTKHAWTSQSLSEVTFGLQHPSEGELSCVLSQLSLMHTDSSKITALPTTERERGGWVLVVNMFFTITELRTHRSMFSVFTQQMADSMRDGRGPRNMNQGGRQAVYSTVGQSAPHKETA